MLVEVVIYTATMCSYCDRAKELLKSKGVNYREISIMSSAKVREEMIRKSGGRKTVPQIFIGGEHIGGFDDLRALDSIGKLDSKLHLHKKFSKPKAKLAPPKPQARASNTLIDKLEEVKDTSDNSKKKDDTKEV